MNIPTTARCPNCGQLLSRVLGGHTTVTLLGGNDRHGIAYACPSCHICLGVEIDPIAVKTEIVAEIRELLNKQ